ncbi:MAG: hypothetical protein ACLFWL_04915 [Candidatus Brocadiia bacterium]
MRETWRQNQILCVLIWGLSLSFCGGCRIFTPQPGPLPQKASREEVLQTLRERAAEVSTIVDTNLSMKIRQKTLQGWEKLPSFGGIIAFDSLRPGLWLRAEKLGQKIFSLRARADSFWLEIPDTHEVIIGGPMAYERLPQLVQPGEVMLWFGAPEWLGLTWDSTTMTADGAYYRFDVKIRSMPIRTVLIDRRQVAVHQILVYDLLGNLQTKVTMDRWKETRGANFPRRLRVERPQQGIRLQLKLGNPKFNKHLTAKVFEPRPRPGWRYINLDRQPLSRVEAFTK